MSYNVLCVKQCLLYAEFDKHMQRCNPANNLVFDW